jgi:hypothetical protein
MIDQLIAHLNGLTYHYEGVHMRLLAVGYAALCVRWGSYLATLIDPRAPAHPDRRNPKGKEAEAYSFIADAEMKRINIEVSYNRFRLIQVYREHGSYALDVLLPKAHHHLPMPQRSVPPNRDGGAYLFAALCTGTQTIDQARTTGHQEDQMMGEAADRFIANILTVHAWRNTVIEDIHAGFALPQPLRPHERRLTLLAEHRLLREVAANLGGLLNEFGYLLDVVRPQTGIAALDAVPVWPGTARAWAATLYGAYASGWSLTDTSSAIML